MAPRFRTCLSALLCTALPCVLGFVTPTPYKRSWGSGVTRRVARPAVERFADDRHRQHATKRALLGPDGKEIDIRRHREANSYLEYWEHFYTSGEAGDLKEGETYDWFFGYSRLAVYLNQYAGGARSGRVLVLGCGNSEVSAKMWQDGWKDIVNIDFSSTVIESMKRTHKDKPGMDWKVMDARDMADLETGSFDAVIDKGLTDSIMYNDKFNLMVAQVSLEVARVLKPGGVYLMTDYREPDRVQELFQRDEWEGGTLEQEGKITPSVRLFKGKRATASTANSEAGAAEAPSEVDMFADTFRGTSEGAREETPPWLVDAMQQGTIDMSDDGPNLDVPHRDVGQDKPFKF